jgi:uncharacterized HAD superfamily protein
VKISITVADKHNEIMYVLINVGIRLPFINSNVKLKPIAATKIFIDF